MTGRGATGLLPPLALAILMMSCSSPQAYPEGLGAPEASLVIHRGEEVLLELDVWIADSAEERGRGLMHVEEMPVDAGMVFLYQGSSFGGFWMKDTLIPLDIAFWDSSLRAIEVLRMEPCRADPCPTYGPNKEYLGAVEANAGVLSGAGVRAGDEVRVE